MSTQPQVATIRQVAGEPTTFEVLSSDGVTWYRCCVKAHNGQGQCSCKRWETVGWVAIRDTGRLPPAKRCRHHKASRELYCTIKIQQEPNYE